ncbi:MAG: hypothetical protein ABH823_00500 [bacterium]
MTRKYLTMAVLIGAGAFLFLSSILTMITGCGGGSTAATSTSTSSTTSTTGVGPTALVGTWSGSWTDTLYQVTGSLEATISLEGSSLSGTGGIDLTDPTFSLGVETGLATAEISGASAIFTFNSGTVGSGLGTITGNTIVGTGEAGPLGFSDFSFIGTFEADGNTINATFAFNSGGYGTAEVTKQ